MDDGSAASDTGASAHHSPAQPRASTSAARFPLCTTASPHPATDSHDDLPDNGGDDDDDDDEEAWDEVDIPQAAAEVPLPDLDGAEDALDAATAAQRAGGGGIEIVISRASTKGKGKAKVCVLLSLSSPLDPVEVGLTRLLMLAARRARRLASA